MSAACYLFIPHTATPEFAALDSSALDSSTLSWVIDDAVNSPKLMAGSLKDFAHQATQYPVIVVLPGERVTFYTAKIPGNNRQRVRQALPYTLEDNVIDDVEGLHFSIADEVTDGAYQVAVIDQHYFQSLINALKQASINPVMLTADYMLLANKNTLFVSGQRILYSGDKLKYATSLDSFIEQHDVLLAKDTPLSLIQTQKEQDHETELETALTNQLVTKEFCEGHEQACLVKYASLDNCINLLQGQFKKQRNWSQTRKNWLPIAALLLLWLSLQGGMFLTEYINLSRQNKKLNNEIVKIYKQTFPDARRIIDAQAQMKQQLESLKKRKGLKGRGFSEMLSGSADVLNKFKGLKIKTLRYFDGHINLELQLTSLQDLDKLKKQLNEEKGYQVDIQNASSEKEFVTARLQITGTAI